MIGLRILRCRGLVWAFHCFKYMHVEYDKNRNEDFERKAHYVSHMTGQSLTGDPKPMLKLCFPLTNKQVQINLKGNVLYKYMQIKPKGLK